MKKDEVGLTVLVTGVIIPFVASFVTYTADVIIEIIDKRRVAKQKKKSKQPIKQKG